MGPQAFEKAFKKRMGGLFSEVKVFFFHDKNKTKIAYIDGDKLKYVEVFRSDYELDYWCNYFAEYLKTGIFDDCAYWRVYTTTEENVRDRIWLSETTPVKMEYVKQVWTVHSPEFNKFMKDVRSQDGMSGVGFNRQPKPIEE